MLFLVYNTSAQIVTVTNPYVRQKMKNARLLTIKAIEYLKEHSLNEACNTFKEDPSWHKGDLNIMILDNKGNYILNTLEPQLSWQNIVVHDPANAPWLREIIEHGEKGGWTLHPTNNDLQAVYVKKIIKHKQVYYVGVGFYPEDSALETLLLARMAISYFRENGAQATFALINDESTFRSGAIAVSVLDENGVLIASAQNPQLANTNLIKNMNDPLAPLARKIIDQAKQAPYGWINITVRKAPSQAYFRRITDPNTGKRYIVFAHYFPDLSVEKVMDFVSEAAQILRTNNFKEAYKKLHALEHGPLNIQVFNSKGDVLIDKNNPKNEGTNMINYRTPRHKRPLIRIMIHQALQEGKGTNSTILFNTAHRLYFERVEKVRVKRETYIVVSGFAPHQKSATAHALVEAAAHFLQEHGPIAAFNEFTLPDTDFIIGDLYLFVYDMKGYCFAYDAHFDAIWQNFIFREDQNGKPIIETLKKIAEEKGEGYADFSLINSTRRVFIKRVDIKKDKLDPTKKENETESYIIGVGYFI